MQTVLDIIRHYNGAGEEDKDMRYEWTKCEECNGSGRRLYLTIKYTADGTTESMEEDFCLCKKGQAMEEDHYAGVNNES